MSCNAKKVNWNEVHHCLVRPASRKQMEKWLLEQQLCWWRHYKFIWHGSKRFFFLLPFLFVPWWQICYLYLGETTITLLSICGFIIIKNRIISSFRLHSKIHVYEKRKGDRYICGANLKKANSFCLLDSWLFAVPMFQSNCFHCAHFAAMSVHFMVVFGVFVQFKLARVFHTVHML